MVSGQEYALRSALSRRIAEAKESLVGDWTADRNGGL